MALFVTSEGRPGDHAFLDGISDTLTEAGLPHNALTVRIFPRNYDAFRAQVRELLLQTDRVTGIICSTARLVGPVLGIAEELGLSAPRDLDVVFNGQPTSAAEGALTHVQTKVPFEQIAGMVAERLAAISEGKPLEPRQVVVPVELHTKSKGQR